MTHNDASNASNGGTQGSTETPPQTNHQIPALRNQALDARNALVERQWEEHLARRLLADIARMDAIAAAAAKAAAGKTVMIDGEQYTQWVRKE